VGAGRRGDVDCVDLGVGDEGAGVVIPAGDAVAAGVVGGFGTVAAHHGDESGVGDFGERGAAFDFGHVAAADDAPADRGGKRWVGGHGIALPRRTGGGFIRNL